MSRQASCLMEEELIPKIRNAARAVVIKDGCILLLLKRDDNGDRYALPGGAQDPGETLEVALQRECLEEINSTVTICRLICIAEAFKSSTRQPGKKWHQLEFLFHCQVPENYTAANGCKPDKHQVDVVWLPLTELADIKIFPQNLEAILASCNYQIDNIYKGVVN